MCGITGIYYFDKTARAEEEHVQQSVITLNKRGPDKQGVFIKNNMGFGHARLAVIDVTDNASQPFTDHSGNYTLVFNGEFYNYLEHRERLLKKGYTFKSTSDTEVLLYLYIDEGPAFLEKINGFFSLAIYNQKDDTLFIARDRMGIKPLLYYVDDKKLVFASEMKALAAYKLQLNIDYNSVFQYFQFNYIPPQNSIYKEVKKLTPGNYLLIQNKTLKEENYYKIPYNKVLESPKNFNEAKNKLRELVLESVEKRMVSDVPLGAFLSGGIDSSVIVAAASKYTGKLNTFSIGFSDQPFFDETKYAELVAQKFNTNHTSFKLSNNDLLNELDEVLNYIDEPFADSSALAVHILSKHTRSKVTVALSGDGADEMFAGYNKHRAHFIANKASYLNSLLKIGYPLLNIFPQSRNSKFQNLIRQFQKLGTGLKLSAEDRYVAWCSILDAKSVSEIMQTNGDANELLMREMQIVDKIGNDKDMNRILCSDMHTVLQGDMLRKVDAMSMANSLEVRTPFLDHKLVDYVFSLPASYKIDNNNQKIILKEAFREELPYQIYKRGKHGFEVPLLQWFNNELSEKINNLWLNPGFIKDQGLFNVNKINELKKKINSSNPGDVQATIWALIVFQHWWINNRS